MARKRKTNRKELSEHRKNEIAKYIIKNQHMTHKQRAYYLGIPYSTEHSVFQEKIVVYQVFMLRDDVIESLTEKSLVPHVLSYPEDK